MTCTSPIGSCQAEEAVVVGEAAESDRIGPRRAGLLAVGLAQQRGRRGVIGVGDGPMSRPAARVSRDPDAIKGDHDLLDSRSAVTTTRRPTKDPVEDQAAAARAAAVEAEHEQRRAPSGPRATVRDDAQVRAQETKVLQAFTDVWLLPVQDRRPAGDASRAEAARLRAAPAAERVVIDCRPMPRWYSPATATRRSARVRSLDRQGYRPVIR